MRDGFIIHQKTIDQIKEMTAEQAGDLLNAMIGHYEGVDPEDQSQLTKILMVDVSERMDADAKAYERVIEQKKAAASKRWNKDADGMREDADACTRIAEDMRTDADGMRETCGDHAGDAVSVSVSDSVPFGKDISGISDEIPRHPEADIHDLTDVQEAWNSIETIPPIKTLGKKRKQLLRARIREHGQQTVLDTVDSIRESAFLQGDNKTGWVITFDWFVKPGNFAKVLEGNYRNKDRPPSTGNAYLDRIDNRLGVVDAWLQEVKS